MALDKPKHCKKCNKKHKDFYADGKCKRCKAARNKKSNKKNNKNRTTEYRQDNRNKNRPQYTSDKFEIESAIRARLPEDLVVSFYGNKQMYALTQDRKNLVVTLNGDTGKADWSADHYVAVGKLQQDSQGRFWSGSHQAPNLIVTTIEYNRQRSARPVSDEYLRPPFAIQRDPEQFRTEAVKTYAKMRGLVRQRLDYDLSGKKIKEPSMGTPDPNDWVLLTPEDFVFPEWGAEYSRWSDAEKEAFSREQWLSECAELEAAIAAEFEYKARKNRVPAFNRIEGYALIFDRVAPLADARDLAEFAERQDWIHILNGLLSGSIKKLSERRTMYGNPTYKDLLLAKREMGHYSELIQLGKPVKWADWGWSIPGEPTLQQYAVESINMDEAMAFADHCFNEYKANGNKHPRGESSFIRWTPPIDLKPHGKEHRAAVAAELKAESQRQSLQTCWSGILPRPSKLNL
ncbi:hypothetical protein [Vibrio sp. CUB2]|uniref:hypothetical protein n=1 Tax=Vibrio sp. CUB2 TaxID=2315233 RepID=UPI000769A86E|nr:hypothetical protein [Vibrio sp. CUB2]